MNEPIKWLYRWFGLTKAQKRRLKYFWKEWGITAPQIGMLVSAICMIVLPILFGVILAALGF